MDGQHQPHHPPRADRIDLCGSERSKGNPSNYRRHPPPGMAVGSVVKGDNDWHCNSKGLWRGSWKDWRRNSRRAGELGNGTIRSGRVSCRLDYRLRRLTSYPRRSRRCCQRWNTSEARIVMQESVVWECPVLSDPRTGSTDHPPYRCHSTTQSLCAGHAATTTLDPGVPFGGASPRGLPAAEERSRRHVCWGTESLCVCCASHNPSFRELCGEDIEPVRLKHESLSNRREPQSPGCIRGRSRRCDPAAPNPFGLGPRVDQQGHASHLSRLYGQAGR